MGNIPIGCGNDLLSIQGMFKHDPTSRSANMFSLRLDLDSNSTTDLCYAQSSMVGRDLLNFVRTRANTVAYDLENHNCQLWHSIRKVYECTKPLHRDCVSHCCVWQTCCLWEVRIHMVSIESLLTKSFCRHCFRLRCLDFAVHFER